MTRNVVIERIAQQIFDEVNIVAHHSPLAVVMTNQYKFRESQAKLTTLANSDAAPRLTAIMLGDAARKPLQHGKTKLIEMARKNRRRRGV
ncbi:MAG: hypothetical protein ACOYLC_14655, partial [Armatimonadaceae bacterium]